MARFLLSCLGMNANLNPKRMLESIHGKGAKVFTSRHHARYFEDDKIYHVLSRVVLGMALLVPSDEINAMVAGVLGHVQKRFPELKLFAHAFLSNHFHLALRGPGIPEFMGQLKQQISYRLKPLIGDACFGRLWEERYAATALITDEDQLRCLEYILSQGVKEGLVERPEQWPGVHCAREVFFGEVCRGGWLNATSYGEAKRAEARKAPVKRRPVSKAEHTEEVVITLTRLPVFEDLGEEEYRRRVSKIRERIIKKGKEARNGKPALGVDAVLKLPRKAQFEAPRPPWFEDRKPMIAWSNPEHPETKAYLERYHRAQAEYDAASLAYRAGNREAMFPTGMYLPPVSPRHGRRLLQAA